MRRSTLALASLVSAAALLASCSNPDSRDDAAPAETTTQAAEETTSEAPLGTCGNGDESAEACAPGEETSEATTESTTSTSRANASGAVESAVGEHVVTVTDTGFILGDPDAAKKVHIYEDFNCPHCVELHSELVDEGAIDKWIAEGASVEITPVNYLGPRTTHNFSGRAAEALALIANKHPEYFGVAQAALFDIRPETTTTELTEGQLVGALKKSGIPLTAEDESALADGEYTAWVDAATAAAAEAEVNFIPQVWVDGQLIDKETPEEVVAAVQ